MRGCLRLLCGLALLVSGGVASAQDFPTKPIKLIVPFPPGGPADIIGRVVGQKMSELIGQPVLIDNRGGAGGAIGTDVTAKSPPDGYTICLSSAGALAISIAMQDKIPYDTLRDLKTVTLIAKVPEVLVLADKVKAANVGELIALAKAQPGKLSFASSGPGSMPHLAGELLKFVTKTDIVHVPYRGAAPAVNDLLGNQVEMMFADMPVLLPHIESGKLKAVAIGSKTRFPGLPNVPTLAEQGFPQIEAENWYGIVVAAATPPAIVAKLNKVLIEVLKAPDVKDKLSSQGAILIGDTPEEFSAYVGAEITKWGEVVKASGAKPN